MKLGTAILYLNKIQKYINGVPHHLISADISSFSPEISNFCYIRKSRSKLTFDQNLTIFEFLKVVLLNTNSMFMMSAKLTTLGFVKIKVYQKGILK